MLLLYPGTAIAQPQVSIRVAVEKQEVVVGEPFRFQIQIEGTNDVEAPDLAAITDDFRVEFMGGNESNSQSITSINGQRTEVVKRAYYLDYRLQAQRTGTLSIPAMEVLAAGKSYSTRPVPIQVTEPKPTNDFFLESELSKDTCYVGEAVYLTTTYYIGKKVREVSYAMPLLALDSLKAEPLLPAREDFEFSINGDRVVAKQGQATRNATTFVTLVFRHALIPQTSGTLTLPRSSVSAQAGTGRRVRSRSFFGGATEEYAPVVTLSNPLTLNVRPLPDEGKPADFSGLIGSFSLSTTASPTTVNVGDPITLNVTLSGSYYLKHVTLPPLQQQIALAAGFRIPDEMAPGVVDGNSKRFTQTIRAQSADITEIPPITLSYFDTKSGTYKTAASKPIPLTVRQTEIVTADDAEGYRPTAETVEHIAVDQGIAHNYTDDSALKHQRFGPNEWLQTTGSWLFLLIPPFLYFMLAAGCFVRNRGGLFKVDHRQRQALPTFETTLGNLDSTQDVHGPVLDALRTYLGTRLERQASALIYDDIEPPLRARGVDNSTLGALKSLFDECEAHRYAGGTGIATENTEFMNRALKCIRTLNEEMGR